MKTILTPLACLPSLGPIIRFISDKLKQLRKYMDTPKRDPRSLVTRSSEVITVLPRYQTQNWDNGRHTSSHSSAEIEMEAKAPKIAKGVHVLGMVETIESALEMRS